MKHIFAAAFAAFLLTSLAASAAAQSCPDGLPQNDAYWSANPGSWPVSFVTVGHDDVPMEMAIDAILSHSADHGSMAALAHQVIAAQLNMASGLDGASVHHYMDEAQHELDKFMDDVQDDSSSDDKSSDDKSSDDDSSDDSSSDDSSSDDGSHDHNSGGNKVMDLTDRLFEFNSGAFCSLPVELVSFDAQADGAQVTLRWATASEVNNAGFEIQHRRGDGYAFETVDFVAGKGSTTASNSYAIDVDNVGFGRHTFRLRQVDLDGTFSYSPEVEINVELTERYALADAYPNPFNPTTNIRFSLREAGQIHLAVYDIIGRHVKTLATGKFSAGSHDVTFSADNLPSGTYLYRLDTESGPISGTLLLLK